MFKNMPSKNQITNIDTEQNKNTTNKPFTTSGSFGKWIFLNSNLTSLKKFQKRFPSDEKEKKPSDTINIPIIAMIE